MVATPDLWVTKDNGESYLELGQPVTYTVVVGNAGPSAADDAGVEDEVPPELLEVAWTCVPSGAAHCSPAAPAT